MTTATTPSSASARPASMLLIRACGYGECRIFPTSIPGMLRSSGYLPAPAVFSAASTIAVGLPMMEKSVMALVAQRNIAKLLCRCVPIEDGTGLAPHEELYARVHQLHRLGGSGSADR